MAQFAIQRPGGISNAQVIINLASSGTPEQVFSYEEISSALGEGMGRTYAQSEVCKIVNKANKRLLKTCSRELVNVPGIGFRIARADEHQHLAVRRQTKADRQIERGMLTLKNVHWEEMDENTRKAHEGQLIIMTGMMEQMRLMQKTQNRHEQLIQSLMGTPTTPMITG